MKIAFCSDVHAGLHRRLGGPVDAGLNRRCRQIVDTLTRSVRRASDLRCDAFVVAGDLFDDARPAPQVIAAVRAALESGSTDMQVIVLLGNHEMVSTAPGDHALAPLAHGCGRIKVVEWPTRWGRLLLVPFRPGDARVWLPADVEMLIGAAPGAATVLCGHVGLIDGDTPDYLRGSAGAIEAASVLALMEQHNLQFAAFGDWHQHASWLDGHLIQIGALVPTGFDNLGLDGYGTLAIYDDEAGDRIVEEIPGPRFLDGEEVAENGCVRDLSASTNCWSFYARLRVPADGLAGGQARLAALIAAGVLVDGVAEIDPADVRARQQDVRGAANAAREAVVLDEAVAAYVGAMPLAEGVDRASVLSHVRGYLKGA